MRLKKLFTIWANMVIIIAAKKAYSVKMLCGIHVAEKFDGAWLSLLKRAQGKGNQEAVESNNESF